MRAGRRPATSPGFLLGVACIVLVFAGCDRPGAVPTPSTGPSLTPGATGSSALRPIATFTPQPRSTSSPSPSVMPSIWPSPSRSVSEQSPTAPPAPTDSPEASLRARIVARAYYYAATETHYRLGSTGPTYFDCTGLVYRVFADCAALELIGAQGEQDVRSYYDWFSARRQADMQSPRPGDLIVYGQDFAHIGIYTGDGQAVSTLTAGVQKHNAFELRSGPGGQIMPVQAYLHLGVR